MRKAQTTLEYAVVIACVVGALIAMSVYVKRGIEGKLRNDADQLGEQYSPGNTRSDIRTKYQADTFTIVETEEVEVEDPDDPKRTIMQLQTTTTTTTGGKVSIPGQEDVQLKPETETRSGYETVGKLEDSLF